MLRLVTPEQMDDPRVPREALGSALAYIRRVNRRLGGVDALLGHLRRWSSRWPKDRPITLLDVGTGSADLPVAAWGWARAAGFDLRITGIDLHETTLEFAREQVGDRPITLERLDAFALVDRFGAGSFDYVHAGLFLHHLSEVGVLTVLAAMNRVATRGIVWNDLVRSRIAATYIHLATLGKPHMVAHDARVSVRAGFTKREVLDIRRRIGLDYTGYHWSLFTHRFTLAGEKPGAWP